MSAANPSLPFLPPTLPLLPLVSPKLLFPFLTVSVPLKEDEIALVLRAVGENGRLDGSRLYVLEGSEDGHRGENNDTRQREQSDQHAVRKGDMIRGDGALEGKSVIAKGERMVAVVPVLEIERRIGRWATAARIKFITISTTSTASDSDRSTKGETTCTLTLEGIARIRLPARLPPVLSLLPPIPLTRCSFALPLPLLHPIGPANSADEARYSPARLLSLARPLLGSAILTGNAVAAKGPAAAVSGSSAGRSLEEAAAVLKEVETRLAGIPVGLLADVLATMLDLDYEVRVDMLGLVGVEERYERLERALRDVLARRGFAGPDFTTKGVESNAMIRLPGAQSNRRPSIRQIGSGQRDSSSPRSSLSGGGGTVSELPEDLQPLYTQLQTRLAALEIPSQPREAIQHELARLIKIPPQSAEYGVGKTYIELMLALPWNKVSPDPDESVVGPDGEARKQSIGQGLEKEREELEREHEGLEGVKKRVLEYLAVYRLKKRNFEETQAQNRARIQAQEDKVKAEQTADDASTTLSAETANDSIDSTTASDLLELIPASQREALSAPSTTPDTAPSAYTEANTAQFRDKGPILLLVGPPGVGKTSIARSLASAMGRVMHRISLGGVRDEAEIRGHRRTYVGALPGLLVSALKRTSVSNPLILLDELDKVSSSSHRGDPAAALLEALDPEQNAAFHDHYLGEVTVDLSRVVFVATANETDTIPPALLDRCEVIECKGYSEDEKVRIAQRFLVGKQCREAGMEGRVEVEEEAVRRVVEGYTMESGVRNLERQIGKLIRAKAVEYANSDSSSTKVSRLSPTETGPEASCTAVANQSSSTYSPLISPDDIHHILGPPPYSPEPPAATPPPGVVHGLGYRGSGMGSVLVIEAIQTPGSGKLKLTGSLGEVIRESAELAVSWVKSRAGALGLGKRDWEGDIHLHLPSGAIKKDGPSAGIAMTIAIVSLLTRRPVPANMAFTGEITLRGAVTAVGGIREKVLAARRAGMTRVVMSHRNEKDVTKDLDERAKAEVEITYIRTIEEGLEAVWGKEIWVGAGAEAGVLARL